MTLTSLLQFHFDLCWDREIEALKEWAASSCVLMLDSLTDICRAQGILGDHMAVTSDVSAPKLAIGVADERYNNVTDAHDSLPKLFVKANSMIRFCSV